MIWNKDDLAWAINPAKEADFEASGNTGYENLCLGLTTPTDLRCTRVNMASGYGFLNSGPTSTVRFDAVNDYLSFSSAASMSNRQNFSFRWRGSIPNYNSYRYVFSTELNNFYIRLNCTSNYLQLSMGTMIATVSPASAWLSGATSEMLVTFDGTQATPNNRVHIYINGADMPITWTYFAPTVTPTITSMSIGRTNILTVNGHLQLAEQYYTTLTAARALELYNLGQDLDVDLVGVPISSGLMDIVDIYSSSSSSDSAFDTDKKVLNHIMVSDSMMFMLTPSNFKDGMLGFIEGQSAEKTADLITFR